MTDETTSPSWAPPALTEEPTGGTLTLSDVGLTGDPDVGIAYKWSKLYARDFEFEPFFKWIDKRSNPERTDFHEILDSLPMHWGPEDLPPPLRRFFLKRFSR